MAFKLFKKEEGDAPPDVGQEEAYDKAHGEESVFGGSSSVVPVAPQVSAAPVVGSAQPGAVGSIELEKMNARVDSIIEWIKQFYERFTYLSESIGSVRTMAMTNEKELSKMVTETSKVVDMVNELEPDKLMVNYQKINLRITAVSERVEAIKQIHENLVNELQELKRRADAFIGVEGLLKLNEDVKKDLIEVKKLSSTVRVNSDKAEQIFMEIRRGFEESQKNMQLVGNLEANYNAFRKEFEKMKLEAASMVRAKDISDIKLAVEKIKTMEAMVNTMGRAVEKSLLLSKKNEENIADIAVTIGKENIKKVNDYENQLASVLEIMASFAAQLRELKKSRGGEDVKAQKSKKGKVEDESNFDKMTDLEKGSQSNEKAIEELKQKLSVVDETLKQKIKENESKEPKPSEEAVVEETKVVEEPKVEAPKSEDTPEVVEPDKKEEVAESPKSV
jgi:hypothetical protein